MKKEVDLKKVINLQKKIYSGFTDVDPKILKVISTRLLCAYKKRLKNNLSQEQFSKIKDLPLDTIKRIELGKCYNLKLISKYVQ